jgi:gamma-glutamyltranspeptidase / glutathione hydrolase
MTIRGMRRFWCLTLVVFVMSIGWGCRHHSASTSSTPAIAEQFVPTRLVPASCGDRKVKAGGVVAAPSDHAAAVGNQILRAGGTAIDAAIAITLTLGVVRPQSSGLGGGGFAVYNLPDGEVKSLDFREVAPSFFNEDIYAEDGRDSRRGPWSVGVPGEAKGLAELHRVGGCLAWFDLVQPALAMARDGFAIERDLALALARRSEKILADEGLARAFAREGKVLEEGALCRRPALAETLAYLQVHGGDSLYEGPLSLSLSGFLANQGLPWTPAELADYKVVHRDVLSGSYRGHTVYSMGPPSSGGLALIESLGILEALGHQSMDFADEAWMRALLGALRHSFADRAAYGGDPDHVEIPIEGLMDSALHQRLAGAIPRFGPVPLDGAGLAAERGDLATLVADDHGTAHLAVIDGDGTAVSLTTTINLDFGSLQADPGTGIILNDEMDDFSAQPGKANAFGLIQGANNRPGAGKRPLSSMSPTLVTDSQGRVVLAVGGAGGPRIISGTLQALLAVLDRGLSPAQAVAAPRLHHQWLPEKVFVEETMPGEGRSQLESEGFVMAGYDYAGVIQAATFDPSSTVYDGGADPRASGGVRVWQP